MPLSKLLSVFTTVLLIQVFANDLVDLSSLDICNDGTLQFHDSQFALNTIDLIKSRLINNSETKLLLLATPYELEKAKAKLLRCTEELMRQNQFKAVEKLIEDVLDPLDLDLSNDIKLIGSQIKKEIDSIMNLAYAKRHTQTVSPAFQWIQSRSNILLQIKFAHRHDAPGCLEVKNEKINFSENAMNFSAFGIQAQLPIQFALDLAFYKDIIPEESSWKLESVGRMFVNITKAVPEVWVSLLKDNEKLPQMRFWWEMKDNFKNEMKEYEKLLEEQEEGEKKKIKKRKKSVERDQAPQQFDDKMEDQPLKQKQMSSKKDFLDDPPSATGSADMNHTHLWSSREDPQSLLVPENRRSINVGPLLKGTHLLKKYMLEEPNKVDTDTALILTATTTPDTLKPPSILKSIKPHVLKVQKSVTISEEIKEKSPLVDLDAKGNTAALNNNSKTKKGFIENFKAFIHKRKPIEKPLSKVIQPKDPSLEPQLEQYKFLNGNLNEWESEEEKLSRLRARHRGSLKGLTVRKKVAVQKVQTTGLLSSWPKTKKALVESIKRNRFVLAPDGRSRITWDMIGMLFILYEVITIPIQISFSVDDTTGFINIVEWLVDIFFISDILLTFNTGYYFRGSLVIDRQKIAKNYFVTWFFVDLLASIPFSRIIQASGSIEENGNTNRLSQSARIIRIVRLFKFIRVVRLIRVFKLQSIFGKLESFISTSPLLNAFAGFMRLGAIILFIAHWIACFWYLIADSESSNTQDTWVTIQQLQDAPWTSQYLASIYWAVTTMITVGYGDIYPITNAERFYAVFTMLLTSVVFAYSMSSISALLRSLDSQNEEYKKTMVWVQRYMKQMNLDRETKLKVKKYLEYTMNEITFRKDDETRLLGLLSDTLKDEVVKKINKKVLENCEPLEMLLKKTFSERFITEMIYFFHEKIFSPREILFTVKDIFRLILNSKEENDVDCSLYMVTMGSVEIILFGCEEMVLQTLRKGNHFGEIEFFTGSKRQWGAKTTDEFASLFFLKRSDLIDLLDSFLNEKEKFNQMKDRICLYQDLSGLEEKCPLCKGLNHSPLQCPTVHYFVDKEKFLGEQIQETYKFRQSFVRRNRNKWHHKHPKKLESIASKIRKNLSSFIEAVENETRNHERPGDDTTSCGDLLTVRTAEIGSQYSPSRKSFMGYVESIAGEHLNNRGKASSRIARPKTPAKKQNKSATFEITFDAVYSFKDYFPHNNVENVIDKLNERLRKAKIMKTMRAIRRVIAFTSIRKKLGIKDTKPKARGHSTPSHDYGVGKIKFVSSDSKYMETLAEIVDPETGLSREASEEKNNNNKLEESAEIVADEKVRFNKIFNKESQEFNKIMKFKKLRDLSPQSPEISPMQINLLSLANLEEEENPKENSEIRETSNHVQPAQKIKENKVHTNCIMDKDYTFMSEPEINKLLSHVLDKYGAGYIQNIINKKHYGE